MKLPMIILASASPRRAELLQQMGCEFEVIASQVCEVHNEQLTARELALVNAYRKARCVAKRHPDAWVLGADTLVYLGTTLFPKPANLQEAHRMLSQLQGKTHEVVTGVCLTHLRGHRQRVFAESTEVTFRRLDRVQIQNYLSRINPLDKAGAYAIQESGDMLVEKISGSFSNVVGLPMERLKAEFAAWTNPL